MLKKVRITNFLSCQDTEIEFDNITALIGRNAAGKTNVLKAMGWCAQFAVGNSWLYNPVSPSKELKTECNIEFLIDDKFFKYEVKIITNPRVKNTILIENLSVYISGEWKIIAERNEEKAAHYNNEEIDTFEINSQAPIINSMLLLLPKKRLNPYINKVFDYLSGVKYYTLYDDEYNNRFFNKFSTTVSDNDYKQWLSKDNKVDSSVVMRLLHLWHEDKELLDELQALIGTNGLNLVDYISIETFVLGKTDVNNPTDCFYIVRFYIEKAVVEYTQLSYGTQRVLAILLAILHDKNSTLLIEQPEDGIHTGLLHKLLPLCFEYAEVYNKQLIITTHSSEAINLFQPENIRLVKMTENGTKVSALDKEQMPFIHDYLKNEGALFDFIKSMNDE